MVTSAVERCAIHLAELDPTRGRENAKTRPVVIVSQEEMNSGLDTVVACPLTTKLHPRWRRQIQITSAGRKADIAADQIRTISKIRPERCIDSLDAPTASRLRLITEMYGE